MNQNVNRRPIHSPKAPEPIGTYSHAIQAGNLVFLSGQIGLDLSGESLVSPEIADQINQTFENMSQVALASGGTLDDVVKLTVYLMDLSHVQHVNDAMATYFNTPYPARAAIQVSALPKGALVEVEAVMVLPNH